MKRMMVVFAAPLLGACAGPRGEPPPDPGQPHARAAPLEFQSTFESYRPFADPELAEWRKANDEVGAAGGHGGHPR